MSINDQDTDPSSPEARRPIPEQQQQQRQPPVAPDDGAPFTQLSPRAATTDPGVGPPAPVSSGPGRGGGVVVPPVSGHAGRGVPASAPVHSVGGQARLKDSVELLLEGMGGPRPDRTKTMPQTAGDASAAYHAEHAVRAGGTARDEEQKVLVDTVRLPPAVAREELMTGPPRRPLDATYVLPARTRRRVVVAALAGLLVVVVIFAYLQRTSPAGSAGPAGPAVASLPPSPAAVPQSPHTGPPPGPAPELPPAVTASQPPPELPATVATETPGTPPAAVATRPRGPGSQPKSRDMGEFKTSF